MNQGGYITPASPLQVEAGREPGRDQLIRAGRVAGQHRVQDGAARHGQPAGRAQLDARADRRRVRFARGAGRPPRCATHTAVKKLRIVILGFGTARQEMVLE
jgi:hypothetical protein